jgi:hypothetical protein
LEIVSNYIKILKMDAASHLQIDETPEKLWNKNLI